MGARALARPSPRGVQSIRDFGLSAEEYVSQRAWESASLKVCPFAAEGGCRLGWNRGGGCRLNQHGSYGRGDARIARLLCVSARRTISLLPVWMAARVSGTLQSIEAAADAVEQRTDSLETLAGQMRPMGADPDKDRVGGMVKWLRCRSRWVTAALLAAQALMPEKLAGCEPTLVAFRATLGTEHVLVALREGLAARLFDVPAPLGLRPRPSSRDQAPHEMGPDPP